MWVLINPGVIINMNFYNIIYIYMFFFPSKKWECLKKGLSKNRVYIYRCLPQIRWLIMILRYVSYEDHHFGVYPVFRPKHPETFDDLKREPGGF